MYCSSCGAQNVEGVKFCKTCGKPLEAEVAAVAPAPAQTPSANVAPQQVTAVPQQTMPTPVVAPAEPKADTGATAAFVLAIIAIVLTFIPIPILSWVAGPCAIIGFGLAFNIRYLAKRNDKELPIKMVLALVFAGYALLNILTQNMASGGGLEALASGLGSFLGGIY